MSLQIRCVIEIGETADDGAGEAGYIRVEAAETVLPVSADSEAADLIALAVAAFDRMVDDAARRTREQLEHLDQLVVD